MRSITQNQNIVMANLPVRWVRWSLVRKILEAAKEPIWFVLQKFKRYMYMCSYTLLDNMFHHFKI